MPQLAQRLPTSMPSAAMPLRARAGSHEHRPYLLPAVGLPSGRAARCCCCCRCCLALTAVAAPMDCRCTLAQQRSASQAADSPASSSWASCRSSWPSHRIARRAAGCGSFGVVRTNSPEGIKMAQTGQHMASSRLQDIIYNICWRLLSYVRLQALRQPYSVAACGSDAIAYVATAISCEAAICVAKSQIRLYQTACLSEIAKSRREVKLTSQVSSFLQLSFATTSAFGEWRRMEEPIPRPRLGYS